MIGVSIDSLRSALTQVDQAIGGAASKAPRSQLQKTIAFLDAHAGKTVEDVVAEIEAAKPPPKAKAPTKPRTPKPKLPVQVDIVERYVANLKLAESALEAFNGLIADLKSDKAVRLDELKLIAAQYSGDDTSLRSKATALGVIQRAFDGRWSIRQHTERVSS